MFVDSNDDDFDERSNENNVKRRKIEKGLTRDNILKPSVRVQIEQEMEVTGDQMRSTTRSRLHNGKREIEYSAKHHSMNIHLQPNHREMRTLRFKKKRAGTGRTSVLVRFEVRKLGEQIQQTFFKYRDEMQTLLNQQDKLFGSAE